MKEAKMMEWKAIDDDDFIANVGDYCLRTEQMSKKHWWFTVYFKDEEIFINIQSAFNEQHGKDLAEIYYKAHSLEKERDKLRENLEFDNAELIEVINQRDELKEWKKIYARDHKTIVDARKAEIKLLEQENQALKEVIETLEEDLKEASEYAVTKEFKVLKDAVREHLKLLDELKEAKAIKNLFNDIKDLIK